MHGCKWSTTVTIPRDQNKKRRDMKVFKNSGIIEQFYSTDPPRPSSSHFWSKFIYVFLKRPRTRKENFFFFQIRTIFFLIMIFRLFAETREWLMKSLKMQKTSKASRTKINKSFKRRLQTPRVNFVRANRGDFQTDFQFQF